MPHRLIEAIEAYDELRKIGFLFSLRYSRKKRIYHDQNFLLRFEKENFRHLVGIQHLEKEQFIIKNSKLLFDKLRGVTQTNFQSNVEFMKIVSDDKYPSIQDRLENISRMAILLKSKTIRVYQKSASNNVLHTKIQFNFLLKLDSYADSGEIPYLFLEQEHDNGLSHLPVSTFRGTKPYEQSHKYREVASLDLVELVYKNELRK